MNRVPRFLYNTNITRVYKTLTRNSTCRLRKSVETNNDIVYLNCCRYGFKFLMIFFRIFYSPSARLSLVTLRGNGMITRRLTATTTTLLLKHGCVCSEPKIIYILPKSLTGIYHGLGKSSPWSKNNAIVREHVQGVLRRFIRSKSPRDRQNLCASVCII